jgi:hypothetical protein
MPSDVTVYYIKDVLQNLKTSAIGSAVLLKCILLKRNKTRKLLILDVYDESGTTQILIERGQVGEDRWASTVELRGGDPITVAGHTTDKYIDPQNTSLNLRVTVVADKVEASKDARPTVDRGRRVIGLVSPITQVYLSRLKQIIASDLSEHGYVEIDTRMISSHPPKRPGPYPLKVHYDGYGAPFYIVPSPVPQLIQLLLSSHYPSAYCISRCFTQGYRDPIVSVESLIISIARRQASIRDLLLLGDEILRKLLVSSGTNTAKKALPKTIIADHGELGQDTGASVLVPEVQIFRQKHPSPEAFEFGRLCWPRPEGKDSGFREYIIAEGHTAGVTESPAFAAMTINIDRLLTLVFEQIELRRIPDISTVISL